MIGDPSSAPTQNGQLPGSSPEALQALLGIGNTDSISAAMDLQSQMDQQQQAEQQRQEQLARDLFSEFTWCRTQKDAYYTPMFNECYDMYRLQIPDERHSGEWRSKISVPYAFNMVEDALPHLMEGVWGGEEPFRLKAPTDGGLVDAYYKLVKWEVEEVVGLENKWESYQRQKAIYGTTCAYVGFQANYRRVKRWKVPKDGMTPAPGPGVPPAQPVLVDEEVPEYVGPTFEVVDPYDIYPHPRATPSKPLKIFWVQRYTIAQMKKTGRFKNLDSITDGMADSGSDDMTAVERRYRTGAANTSGRYPNEKIFRIITCYDDVEKKVASFTYNGNVLVEESDYPFMHDRMPLVFDRYTELPLEFWGVGPVETAMSLIHEGNAIRNQRRDNVNLIVNAMMEVRDGDIDDEEDELVFQPGGVIHSRSGDAARFLQPPMITQDSVSEENRVSADIDRLTGLGGPISGQNAKGVSSATGTSLIQKAQILRLSRAIDRSAKAFKEVISQFVALNVQFLPLPEVQSVLGVMHMQDYADVEQHQLMMRCTVVVQPAGVYQNDDLYRQQLTNLLNILGSNPTFSQKVNWDYLLRQVLRAFNVEDLTQALNKPQGINVMQVAMAFHENQEMTQGQQIPPAQVGDDYDLHVPSHQMLLNMRPDLFQVVGQHLASHDQAKAMAEMQQQKQQLMALNGQAQASGGGQNGPGSAPPGQNGGVNPARQPSAAGMDSTAHAVSRMAPRGA